MAKRMTERERLEEAIDLLERRRAELGGAVVEAASAPLRAKLTALNRQIERATEEPVNDPTAELLAGPQSPGGSPAILFDGERRVVSILFCDVQGSTAMAEKLDPEEWARTIQSAMEYLTGPVGRHGGRVAEVRGDGILAFFGAPLAHEDDPQRAVLAGLEIIEGVQAFQEQMQREHRLDFNVRVGIHTGLVVVGEVGRELQMEYAAFGDAMNLAARMEQTAQPGTVQISAQTYQLVKQVFNCEPLGDIKVKGKRKPIQTYQVLDLKAERVPLRGLEWQGLHSPLVGREAEFATVKESLERLLSGEGGILGIFGEAGIGKSRLIEEIHQEFPQDRLGWLEGHNLSYGSSISYWPFQEILRSYADINDRDTEDQAWDKLEGHITALFSEKSVGTSPTVAEILPYLASLLGMKVRDEYLGRVQYLDGEALGRQIFLASRRFFERLASTRPVVLVFEDLQWLDEASAGLLEHLLPLVEQAPLLIYGLGRPSWETPSGRLMSIIERDHRTRYTAIQLAPLTQDDSTQLVSNLLDVEALPAELHDMIVHKAEGNPFFMEEILRTLIDLGALQREAAGGNWRVTVPIESLAIPDSVQGVILARVDRLEKEVRDVLRVAAVIGRSFLYRVLRAVTEAGSRLDGHLAELKTIEFIQEKQSAPDLEYIFKHVLAHEATYQSILLEKRRALHAQVGRVIESLFTERLEEFYGMLAYHYAKAEAWEQAQTYLLKSADQAGRMAADNQALEQYRQAQAAYERAFGEAWDPVERAGLERKIGEAFFRRGEWTQALRILRQALTHLGYPLPDSRWGVRLALLLEVPLQIGHALFPGLFRKQNAGPAEEEQLKIYQILEVLVAARDPKFSLLVGLRMLNFCEQYDLPAGAARASAGLGIVLGEFLHLPRLAEHYLYQAVRVADQLHRPDVLGLPYTGLITHEGIMKGEWEPALDYGLRFAGAMQEIGNLGEYSVAVFITATILIWKGDLMRALADGQEQAQLGREAAETQTLASGLWVQGFAERCLGRLEAAIGHLSRALEVAEASGNVFLRVQAASQLGQCYLRQAQWQTALDILESNDSFIAEHNFRRAPFPNAMLWNSLAGAYLLASERSVRRERNVWLEKAGRACRTALKWGKMLRPEMPEALRLQGQYAWLCGNSAQAQSWWRKSLAEAERLGMPYEAGITHLEIGQRVGDLDHLKKAEGIFAKIGAERDLSEVREFLTIISPNWASES